MRIQTHIHTYRKPTQDNVGSVYMKLLYLDKSSVDHSEGLVQHGDLQLEMQQVNMMYN